MTKQERAVRTRNALIEAAAELFHRDGFGTTSLAMVTARAKVSNGALYFHFATKADLAEAVVASAAARLTRIVDAGAGTDAPGRGPAQQCELQRLIDVTHAFVRALGSDVVLRAGFDLCGVRERTAAGGDLRDAWREWVQGALAEAEARGALAPGVSARAAAVPVIAATVGIEVLGAYDGQWLSPDPLTWFWRLLLPALAAAPGRRALTAAGSGAGR
ncbi:ScbR family autoregulator-binding transcription factor [Streptomyces phaeochromogenes]|uniref:ScbR family autoregulator-binding transcription factor n=1 Tax=Streptomyces phaeochromogenes TaxID=1923 RepID=UPI0036B45E85